MNRDQLWQEYNRRKDRKEETADAWYASMTADLRQREQTAATILAALVQREGESGWYLTGAVTVLPEPDPSRVRYAAALADALREAL